MIVSLCMLLRPEEEEEEEKRKHALLRGNECRAFNHTADIRPTCTMYNVHVHTYFRKT